MAILSFAFGLVPAGWLGSAFIDEDFSEAGLRKSVVRSDGIAESEAIPPSFALWLCAKSARQDWRLEIGKGAVSDHPVRDC